MFKYVRKTPTNLKEGDKAIEIIQQEKNNKFIGVILMTKPGERCQISNVVTEMKWWPQHHHHHRYHQQYNSDFTHQREKNLGTFNNIQYDKGVKKLLSPKQSAIL